MEQELKISNYEISKQLQELGFNWKDYSLYINDFHEDGNIEYVAPTQSLVIKWFRDVHNIHISTMPNSYYKRKLLGFVYIIGVFDENNIHNGIDYDKDQMNKLGEKVQGFETTEDAEEAGIIKCIDILKNKLDK
jgi:virulence-associated protein VapD